MDSCGPSNGAKSLQRHLAQDRSIQQDAARAQQSTGSAAFRQTGQHAVQQADAAVQAFQQGRSQDGRFGAQIQSRIPMSAQIPGQQAHRQHAWTSDFERQGVASKAPVQHAQGGWGADFLAFQQQQQSQQQNTSHVNAMYGMGPAMMRGFAHGPSMMQPMVHLNGQRQDAPWRQAREVDNQAFSDAFALAEQSVAGLSLEQRSHSAAMQRPGHEEGLQFANQDEAMQHIVNQEGPIAQEQRREIEHNQENEALSRIAGDLINAVAADQQQRSQVADDNTQQIPAAMSDKFRNSNFMKLMHALRDGQVALTQDGQGLADTVTGEQVSVAEPPVQVPEPTAEDHQQIEEQQRRRLRGDVGGGTPSYKSSYTFDDSLEAMNEELKLSM